nr:MAG TPA: hypothetical protein [Caudoviricetes sp.]
MRSPFLCCNVRPSTTCVPSSSHVANTNVGLFKAFQIPPFSFGVQSSNF